MYSSACIYTLYICTVCNSRCLIIAAGALCIVACGTCPIAAIWLPRALIFTFVFLLVSPASFVESEQD